MGQLMCQKFITLLLSILYIQMNNNDGRKKPHVPKQSDRKSFFSMNSENARNKIKPSFMTGILLNYALTVWMIALMVVKWCLKWTANKYWCQTRKADGEEEIIKGKKGFW